LLSKDGSLRDLFDILVWTLKHTNVYFRVLHGAGIWIDAGNAATAVTSGWKMCEPSLGYRPTVGESELPKEKSRCLLGLTGGCRLPKLPGNGLP